MCHQGRAEPYGSRRRGVYKASHGADSAEGGFGGEEEWSRAARAKTEEGRGCTTHAWLKHGAREEG